MRIKENTKKGYKDVKVGGCFNMAFPNSKTRRGRVQGEDGSIAPTLDTNCEIATIVYEGEEIAVRRLTPKECFRLQGFPDEYFERARKVNSDSKLYEQAGNSVTVDVIEAIAKRLEL